MVGAVEQRRREPVGVAAVGDLADELVDEVAAVGEDQDAAGARGLDEADGGDGLAGAGRVLEPEAAAGARVLGRLLDDVLVLVASSSPRAPPPRWPPPRPRPRSASSARPPSAPAPFSGGARPWRGRGRGRCRSRCRSRRWPLRRSWTSAISAARVPERASTWWAVELGAVGEVRLLLGEQALEAEHQREVAAPLDRGGLAALVDLGEGGVQRPAARACPRRGPSASRPRAGTARARTRARARYRRW